MYYLLSNYNEMLCDFIVIEQRLEIPVGHRFFYNRKLNFNSFRAEKDYKDGNYRTHEIYVSQ